MSSEECFYYQDRVGVHFECLMSCCSCVSDTSLRDGLFHEYKKFGKVMSVSIKGEKEERFAIVTFKKYVCPNCSFPPPIISRFNCQMLVPTNTPLENVLFCSLELFHDVGLMLLE